MPHAPSLPLQLGKGVWMEGVSECGLVLAEGACAPTGDVGSHLHGWRGEVFKWLKAVRGVEVAESCEIPHPGSVFGSRF